MLTAHYYWVLEILVIAHYYYSLSDQTSQIHLTHLAHQIRQKQEKKDIVTDVDQILTMVVALIAQQEEINAGNV